MSDQSQSSPQSPLDANRSLNASSALEISTTPTAADRMYQLAALTAGLFLLVTLL